MCAIPTGNFKFHVEGQPALRANFNKRRLSDFVVFGYGITTLYMQDDSVVSGSFLKEEDGFVYMKMPDASEKKVSVSGDLKR